MMATTVRADRERFEADPPRQLFEGNYLLGVVERNYDVTADSRRFLMIRLAVSDSAGEIEPEIAVVENFDEELKRLVPVD